MTLILLVKGDKMDKLRVIALKKIKDYENVNTKEALEEYKKIKLIEELLKDDACFFKMNINIAYSILLELGIVNPIEYYKKLISYEEFNKNKENFEL